MKCRAAVIANNFCLCKRYPVTLCHSLSVSSPRFCVRESRMRGGAAERCSKVFVRIRPFTPQESAAHLDECVAVACDSSLATSCVVQPSKQQPKSFDDFAYVFPPECRNAQVYEKAVKPLLPVACAGGVGACFCYGHTSAGKTHTICGYGEEFGLFVFALRELFAELPSLSTERHRVMPVIRFAEIYNDSAYDLLSERSPLTLREDEDGEIRFRGPTVTTASGEVSVTQLTALPATTFDDAMQIVRRGLKYRAAGSSNLHDQASRSHAFLEFQLVTSEWLQCQEAVRAAEAAMVPDAKARDGVKMVVEAYMYKRNPDTGRWIGRPPPPEMDAELEAVEAKVRPHVQKIAQLKQSEAAASNGLPCLGGSLVFVDLAGAESCEIAQRSQLNRQPQSKQSSKEARQINTSLLAVSACIRALHCTEQQKANHIPFRDSKLTLALKKYLNAVGCHTVMIANVCPVEEQLMLSRKTLMYAQAVSKGASHT